MYCYIHYWECPVWQTEETEPREYESRIAEIFQQDLSNYFRSLSLAETVSYATTLYENSVCSFLISRLFLFRSKGGDAIEALKVLKFTLKDTKSLISLTPTTSGTKSSNGPSQGFITEFATTAAWEV